MMTCHRILRGKIGGRVTNLVMGVILFTLPVFSYALNVVVTVDNHLKAPANYLMHRVVVSNTDSTTRSNVVLTTNVPTGSVIYESSMLPSSDNSCPSTTCDVGETPIWNLGSMSPGEFRVLTIPILIISSTADGSTLNFDIAVTYDGASSASTTSIETKVASSPVAALSISADHQVVASGGKVSYQVSFGNIGSSGFASTALSVSIPSGLSLVSASDNGSQSGSNIVWDIGVLNGGEGSKRYFTLQIDDAAQQGNIYVNQAVLSNSGSELVTSGESVVIRENLALSLDVTADMDVLQPGNYAYYRYVIANTGSTSLTDVELNVMMAERSRFYELSSLPYISSCASTTCDAGEWGTYVIGQLDAGESRVLTVPVYQGSPIDGEPLVSYALLTEGSGEYRLGTKPTVIFSAQSSLELSISAQEQVVAAGQRTRYEISYGNVDTSAYQNLALEVVLPEGATFVEASDGGVLSGSVVTWDLATLNAGNGGKRFLLMTAPADAIEGEVLVSEASLNIGGPALVTSGESVVIRENLALTLDVTMDMDVLQPDNYAYYRYVVANTGSTSLTDVELNIMMAERSRFYELSSLPYISSCASTTCDAGEWGTYAIGQLDAGESRVLTVPVYQSSPIDGEPLVSYALLTEGSGAYRLGTKPTVIFSAQNNLELSISAEDQVVAAGQRTRYEISYGNVDTSAYQNLALEVVLPEGATFVEASDGGVLSGSVVTWDLATLNAGNGGKRFLLMSAPADAIEGDVLVSEASLNIGGPALLTSGESVVVRENVALTLDVGVIGDRLQLEHYSFYRYVIANTGSTSLTDVELNIMMAERSRFYELSSLPYISSCASTTCDAGEWGTYAIGQLDAGESRVLIIPFYGASVLDGEPLVSYALVTEGSGKYRLGTKPTVIYDESVQPQLAIQADKFLLGLSEQQNFSVLIGNPTNSAITNGVVKVTLAQGYSLLSAAGTYELVGNVIHWPIGILNANQWLELPFVLQTDASLLNASTLTIHVELESDSELSGIAFASINSVIDTTVDMSLSVSNSPTTNPIDASTQIAMSVMADNVGSRQLADVTMSFMVPTFTYALEDADLVGCASTTCDSGEWATWLIGALNQSAIASTVITPIVNNSVSNGNLLISNVQLSHSSNNRHDIALTQTLGVGTEFVVDPDHDSDADGIPDWWEIRWGYDRLDSSDGTLDDDNDGSENLEEYTEGTDPTTQDSDSDGILDGPDTILGDELPTANAGSDQTLAQLSASMLDGSASGQADDPENSVALSYNWQQLSGTTVVLTGADTSTPSFTTPSVNGTQTLSFRLTVTDFTGNSDVDEVSVVVSDAGQVGTAPVANGGADQSVNEGSNVSLDGSGSSDVDDDIATYSWAQTSGTVVTLTNSTSVSAEFVAPDVDAEQVLTFTLTVTDQGGLTSTDEVSITVAVVVVGSSAPVANAGADQSVIEGGSVTLDGSASSDVDDDIASYSWVQSAGDSVSLNNADTVTASFTAPSVSAATTITLSLTVTDTAGNSSTDDISVTINPETTTTPPPTTGNNDGGGGAIGWLSLMALMLFAYRYTQANKR